MRASTAYIYCYVLELHSRFICSVVLAHVDLCVRGFRIIFDLDLYSMHFWVMSANR